MEDTKPSADRIPQTKHEVERAAELERERLRKEMEALLSNEAAKKKG